MFKLLFKKIWDYVFFGRVDPLIKMGRQKPLTEKDIMDLPQFLDPRVQFNPSQNIRWTDSKYLPWDLIRVAKKVLVPALIFNLGASAFQLLSPIVINQFITTLSVNSFDQLTLVKAILLGLSLSVIALFVGLGHQHYFYRVLLNHQLITNVVNEKIYNHSLRLKKGSQNQTTVGDIVNHMSSDSDTVSDFAAFICDLIVSSLTIIGAVGLLFYYLGWSALGAIATMLIMAPVSKLLAKRFTHLDEVMMKYRDQRVTLMSQLLNAIRVIKYFGWEKSIKKEVRDVRELELKAREKLARSNLVATMIYIIISTLVVFVSLGIHVLRGFELSAALIFTCVALFEVLELPFGNMSRIISNLMNAKVSVQRLTQFFKAEILPDDANQILSKELSVKTVGLSLKNFSATYNDFSLPVVKNWNLKIEPTQKIAIIGPVGAGKTSFLMSLLGEIKNSGELFWSEVPHRVALVSQEAYIINASLRENLQFGNTHLSDDELLHALKLAVFDHDLNLLPAGLNTEIGEKGVNLSGGQKQRISLARAFLHKPQLVLLDDPLSAVDVKTETALFYNLIQGAWKDTTVIVVTHRLEHLNEFDKIVFVKDGSILVEGRFDELKAVSTEFNQFLFEHEQSVKSELEVQTEVQNKVDQDLSHRQTTDEDREFGAVHTSVYWDYVKSLGGNSEYKNWIIGLLILCAVLGALFPLFERAWLAQGVSRFSGLMLMAVYGVLALSSLTMILFSDYFWMKRGLKAGRLLHDQMLDSVLGAKIRFFDSTPMGRVVQRFSRDMENIDIELQWSFENTVKAFVKVVVTLFLIVSLVPLMLIFMVPVLFLYYFLQKSYRMSAREVKRMDSISRSPRYAHFKETLLGLINIRAYKKQNYFREEFYKKLKHNQRMFYGHFMVNRWFSAKIPLIGSMISLITTTSAVVSIYNGWISVGTVGLITVYSLSFWEILNWGIRIFADVEAKMTSVERVKYFSQLEQEQEVLSEPKLDYKNWPQSPSIEFCDVQAQYASHLPMVLKGLSFKIEPYEKIGIIGRTGSGKSTIFQTLYRFIELTAGQIVIDGVDIASVPLSILRKKLAIIPQDPTMFIGTLRQNLDRYNEYTDEEIWSVLARVELSTFVSQLDMQLNTTVVENGANFSQGQRQLFCLARALLLDAPIIILDEATASVDVKTDHQVQKVVRETSKNKTVLIIAHRLGTVRDCDKIFEISAGHLKRTITPHAKALQSAQTN